MTNNKKLIYTLVFGAAVWAACGDDPAPQPADMADADMPVGMDMDMGGQPDLEPDQCAPKTMCEPDSCGEQPDGCGGTLSCGACTCAGGMPVKATCGQCELGITVCSSATEGSCEQVNWFGVTALECKNIVYVAWDAPADGAGTRDQPMGDLQKAIDKAFNLGNGSIVAIGGAETFKLDKPLEVLNRIHVIGGFDRDTWQRSDDRPEILLEGQAGDHVVGVQAHNITSKTVLANLRVTVRENLKPGGNVYAIHAYNASGLVLEQVYARAASAPKGDDGAPGMPGAPGGNGVDGKEGRSPGAFCGYNPDGTCEPRGGTNPSCPQDPNQPNQPLGGNGGRDGTAGTNGIDGLLGGAGGRDVTNARDGQPGQDASGDVNAPTHGTKGPSAGLVEAQERFFTHLGWGGKGGDGARGRSGGGGGGAAGINTFGAFGAGGGAGGCGGGGGGGGQPGGSVFGLFVVDSQNLVVRGSTFEAGTGGKGGAAAQGAAGGAGGRGGTGLSYTEAGTMLRSGNGGRGGLGSPGGDGAGGAGGFSFGAWCARSVLEVEGEVNFIKGVPGAGGNPPQGLLELQGDTGRSGEQEECLPSN